MSIPEAADTPSPWSWWEGRRRLLYNLALIAALGLGGLMFIASVSLSMVQNPLPASPDGELPEITVFTLIFQAVACLVGLIAANILYTGGPLMDGLLPRAARSAYRRWSYGLGVAFSLVVVLALPAIMMVTVAASLLAT